MNLYSCGKGSIEVSPHENSVSGGVESGQKSALFRVPFNGRCLFDCGEQVFHFGAFSSEMIAVASATMPTGTVNLANAELGDSVDFTGVVDE